MLNNIDLERVKSEKTLPPQIKKIITDNEFGVARFGCYIVHYSEYPTINEFVRCATEDEWIDIERMYLDDWETRKYSKIFQDTINGIENMDIKKENMKKLLRNDISDFYRYYNISIG